MIRFFSILFQKYVYLHNNLLISSMLKTKNGKEKNIGNFAEKESGSVKKKKKSYIDKNLTKNTKQWKNWFWCPKKTHWPSVCHKTGSASRYCAFCVIPMKKAHIRLNRSLSLLSAKNVSVIMWCQPDGWGESREKRDWDGKEAASASFFRGRLNVLKYLLFLPIENNRLSRCKKGR